MRRRLWLIPVALLAVAVGSYFAWQGPPRDPLLRETGKPISLTGTIRHPARGFHEDPMVVNEGPEAAAKLFDLIRAKPDPNLSKCQIYGDLTLTFDNNHSYIVGMGCCTIFRNHDGFKSIACGSSSVKEFLESLPSSDAATKK